MQLRLGGKSIGFVARHLGNSFRQLVAHMLPILFAQDLLGAHGAGAAQIGLVAFLLRFPLLHLRPQGVDSGRLFRARCLKGAIVQQRQHFSAADMISNLHADRGHAAVAFGHDVSLLFYDQRAVGGEVAPIARCMGGKTGRQVWHRPGHRLRSRIGCWR